MSVDLRARLKAIQEASKAATGLMLLLVLTAIAAAALTIAALPQSGGYCSPAAQQARHADIVSEHGTREPITTTDRACQR